MILGDRTKMILYVVDFQFDKINKIKVWGLPELLRFSKKVRL